MFLLDTNWTTISEGIGTSLCSVLFVNLVSFGFWFVIFVVVVHFVVEFLAYGGPETQDK